MNAKAQDKQARAVVPALLSAKTAAEYCGISRASWWKMKTSGRCPAPIRLGRRLLWRRVELDQWIAQGCPAVNKARAEQYRRDREIELTELTKKETAG